MPCHAVQPASQPLARSSHFLDDRSQPIISKAPAGGPRAESDMPWRRARRHVKWNGIDLGKEEEKKIRKEKRGNGRRRKEKKEKKEKKAKKKKKWHVLCVAPMQLGRGGLHMWDLHVGHCRVPLARETQMLRFQRRYCTIVPPAFNVVAAWPLSPSLGPPLA
ncbi:hypothetical protein K504DRAFT_451645 [Pleomassaria siparia CBS 279.74]|uniref:Uncharacterized protein n=1 Tax=Pleomassaria siparia CBS 279.74 TaxID=1314801 RepID=A0A6G1JSH8_9PLEO|nr:hypothetical protein K504DRAFT_451645 [Pleomassaria siparia CBS 279.74]